MTGEQTIRIIGTEAAPVWLRFDKDYINGQFDFTVEAGSTAPRNEAFRRDMALQMVSAMQPFAQAGLVNLEKLAAHVLGVGFGVKNPESFLIKPPAAPEQMAPEGEMPPELMDQLMAQQGIMPQMGPEQGGLPPELAGLGMPPAGPAPQGMEIPQELLAQLPPEFQSLPPELLMQLLEEAAQQPPM